LREFFALPTAEKMRACPPEQAKSRGYLPVGIESVAATLDADTPPDLCEALVFAALARPPSPSGKLNIWPEQPAGLRDLVMRYNRELDALGKHLARLAALALDLAERDLDSYFADPSMTLRFVNYPDQPAPPLPGQLRYGAHHDYGGLTILRQDEAPGGLEVCDAGGSWHEVPPSPGGFVINVGDMLSEITGGRFKSPLHRVINKAGVARYSIPFFFDPNFDARFAAMPEVSAGEYLLGKFNKFYKHRKEAAAS